MFLLIINIGMLVSSGFSVYLMTQSLESYNLMVHLKLLVTLPCTYSKTILPTQDTGVPIPPTPWSHNGVLILIAILLWSTAVQR